MPNRRTVSAPWRTVVGRSHRPDDLHLHLTAAIAVAVVAKERKKKKKEQKKIEKNRGCSASWNFRSYHRVSVSLDTTAEVSVLARGWKSANGRRHRWQWVTATRRLLLMDCLSSTPPDYPRILSRCLSSPGPCRPIVSHRRKRERERQGVKRFLAKIQRESERRFFVVRSIRDLLPSRWLRWRIVCWVSIPRLEFSC